jgi:hypothetical protein
MKVDITVLHSRPFSPTFSDIKFGKYLLRSLPTDEGSGRSARWRSLITFLDEMRSGENSSQPLVESQHVVAFLSAHFRMRIEIEGLALNGVNGLYTADNRALYPDFEKQVKDLDGLEGEYFKLSSLDLDTGRQYLRACDCYRLAQDLIPKNTTLAYFLLTISIECLAQKLVPSDPSKPGSQTCDKFIKFLNDFLPESIKSEWPGKEGLPTVLKEVYYNHRSGFTHGGKEIPDAVLLADRLKRDYVKNLIDGNEVRTPGLRWFEKIVAGALNEFLRRSNGQKEGSLLKDISLEKGSVMLKVKTSLSKGTIVTAENADLD